jgi:hypothetical protein
MSYLINFLGGRKQTQSGVLFAQTVDSTEVVNTVTETTISDTGYGSLVLPANFLTVGKCLKIRGYGIHSSTGNPTITLKIKLGSTVVGTVTGTSGNGTNDEFQFEGILVCRTVGASGTVQTNGSYFELHGSGLIEGGGGLVTLNTTISQTLSVTFEWGTASAGNTLTLKNLILECLN